MQKKQKINSFARRDRLLEIESKARELWDKNNIYQREIDLN